MQINNTFVLEHPLLQHKMTLLRDKNTSTKDFRELIDEISMLMAYEISKDLPLTEVTIETPIATTTSRVLARKVSLVPILRAGVGMVAGIQRLLPTARVGFLGMYRDHDTHQPVQYYCKMPDDIADSTVMVLDPMFATAGSATAAIEYLESIGCKDIRFVCVVASRYAVDRIYREHPEIQVFCAALDEELNEDCYIVPGLGDAGDRIFGTK